MKNSEKVKELGAGNVRFYRDKIQVNEHGRAEGGVLTVCLIRRPKHTIVIVGSGGQRETIPGYFIRGIAYCSPEDQFVKKTGIAIALGRALQCLEKEYDGMQIPSGIHKLLKKTWDSPISLAGAYITRPRELLWFAEKISEDSCGVPLSAQEKKLFKEKKS